jgi:hypothetical protein
MTCNGSRAPGVPVASEKSFRGVMAAVRAQASRASAGRAGHGRPAGEARNGGAEAFDFWVCAAAAWTAIMACRPVRASNSRSRGFRDVARGGQGPAAVVVGKHDQRASPALVRAPVHAGWRCAGGAQAEQGERQEPFLRAGHSGAREPGGRRPVRGSRLVRAVGQGEPERGVPGGEHADEGSAATLHRQLDAYLNEVVSHDWPQMREGRLGDDSERMIAAMYASALRANPATNAQSAARPRRRRDRR